MVLTFLAGLLSRDAPPREPLVVRSLHSATLICRAHFARLCIGLVVHSRHLTTIVHLPAMPVSPRG